MIPVKGELRYFHVADRPYRDGSIYESSGSIVMQIYDGAGWVPLESNEGLAVVNEMIRMLTETCAAVRDANEMKELR